MPTAHSGFLIQSRNFDRSDFELVVASPLGGLAHCWRDNFDPALPWIGPYPFGSGDGEGVSLIQSTFGTPEVGHLEVVVRTGDRLTHYWRDDVYPYNWHGPDFFASGVSGNPALVQGSWGFTGNFELVTPLAGGGLAHYWRNNDDPALPWIGPTVFGIGVGPADAVSMIQSTFSAPGTLEVIARVGGSLVQFWRDAGPPWEWHGPVPVPLVGLPPGATAGGVPGFIQSRFGFIGNYEVVTPLSTGGMAHLWRDNNSPGLPWSPVTVFGQGIVSAVGLIQSNFGRPGLGSLEVTARTGGRTAHYWREDGPPWAWHGPSAFACDEPRCDTATKGEWRVPYSSGAVGIHAALLHTGKVLFFAYEEGDFFRGSGSVLDPVTGEATRHAIDRDPFCGGNAFLPDGRLFVAGGFFDTGLRSLHTFTPDADGGTWQDLGDMPEDRWYPTCTTLADGRIFIISGVKGGSGPQVNPFTCDHALPINDTYAIYDPATGLGPDGPAPFLIETDPYSNYPFVFLLPNGKLLIHANDRSRLFDLATGSFDSPLYPTVSGVARTYPNQAACVLLPLMPNSSPAYRARVMLFGGGGVSCPTPVTDDTPATAACEVLDLGVSNPAWRAAAPMLHRRVMPDAVLLPDGTVLVMNGSSTGVADNGINPVLDVDLYDPRTDSWTAMCPMRVPRLYHSVALLLPDGRVLAAGKDEEFNRDPFHYPEYRVEVFSPPYLFKGPRPRITAAPANIAYGTDFQVQSPDYLGIASAALIRPGAVTHSFNMEQRYVGLTIRGRPAGRLTIAAPPGGTVAPPGYYLLFLVNTNGVPSMASFVRLG